MPDYADVSLCVAAENKGKVFSLDAIVYLRQLSHIPKLGFPDLLGYVN